jgi:hypothetical protein
VQHEYGPYEFWELALANPKELKERAYRITLEPQLGFYRTKTGKAVAIWEDQDGLQMTIDGEDVPHDRQEDIWTRCAYRPVSEDTYRHVVDEGGIWPDIDPAVAGIGDNRRKGGDAEAIIDELAEVADSYKAIDDDDTAKRAISLRAALLEQHGAVDKVREEAKKPFLKAAREVDEIWMPIVKKAKKAADTLRALVEGWETRKRKAARFAEEQRAIEAQHEFMRDAVVPAPPPSDQIASGYGRAVSVRARNVVTGIRDIDEVFRWYRGDARLVSALLKMAQDDVDDGNAPAGVVVEEQAVVR